MFRALLIALLASAVSVAFATEPGPVHHIEISADVPSVAVAPRPPGRFTMRLPGLTYALTMTADCGKNWNPDSVSISVADSRISFNKDQLQDGDLLEFELRVPSQQIGPLRLEQFCVISEQANIAEHSTITIESLLSAQASLRCATDAEQSTRYVTVPLDVSLECVVPEPVEN
jgi:hypothetical protein